MRMNVALDIYELADAGNALEKAVFGTQLAFDSASFLASVGAAYAGVIEASTLAATLGGAGVLLGGLGIGFGALVKAFGQTLLSVLPLLWTHLACRSTARVHKPYTVLGGMQTKLVCDLRR